jgi:type IV secretion system protein VirD4
MPIRIRPLALLIAFVVLMASNSWLKGIFGPVKSQPMCRSC